MKWFTRTEPTLSRPSYIDPVLHLPITQAGRVPVKWKKDQVVPICKKGPHTNPSTTALPACLCWNPNHGNFPSTQQNAALHQGKCNALAEYSIMGTPQEAIEVKKALGVLVDQQAKFREQAVAAACHQLGQLDSLTNQTHLKKPYTYWAKLWSAHTWSTVIRYGTCSVLQTGDMSRGYNWERPVN